MSDLLTHKASDLKPQTRAALEAEFGRSLRDDEEVSIMAFHPHDAPTGAAHAAAVRRLDASLAAIEARVKDIPAEEYDEIVLEAMRSVRGPGYEERR